MVDSTSTIFERHGIFPHSMDSIEGYMLTTKPVMLEKLSQHLRDFHQANPYAGVKFMTRLSAVFQDPKGQFHNIQLPSESRIAYNNDMFALNQFESAYQEWKNMVIQSYDQAKGPSDMMFQSCPSLSMKLWKIDPIKAGSFIPKPTWMKNGVADLDLAQCGRFVGAALLDTCFEASLVRIKFGSKIGNNHRNEIRRYMNWMSDQTQNKKGHFNMTGFTVPLNVTHIRKVVHQIEKQNSNIPISIWLYDLDNSKNKQSIDDLVCLYYSSNRPLAEDNLHYRLILFQQEGNYHFAPIVNFNALFGSRSHGNNHFCTICLHNFKSAPALQRHTERGGCKAKDPSKVVLPDENNPIKFKEWAKTQWHQYMLIADSESIISNERRHYSQSWSQLLVQVWSEEQTDAEGKTAIEMKSEILKEYNTDFRIIPPNNNAVAHAISVQDYLQATRSAIERVAIDMYNFQDPAPILEEENMKKHAVQCHICHGEEGEFNQQDENGKSIRDSCKVFDRDHVTGKLRGIAHAGCNRKARRPNFIPVFMQNGPNYDHPQILSMIKQVMHPKDDLVVIPKSMNHYISFGWKIWLGQKRYDYTAGRMMLDGTKVDYQQRMIAPPQRGIEEEFKEAVEGLPQDSKEYIELKKKKATELQELHKEAKKKYPDQYIEIRFLDSLAHLKAGGNPSDSHDSAGLAALSNNLPDVNKHLTKQYCQEMCARYHTDYEQTWRFFKHKGTFCYEYIDCYERVYESKLPTASTERNGKRVWKQDSDYYAAQ